MSHHGRNICMIVMDHYIDVYAHADLAQKYSGVGLQKILSPGCAPRKKALFFRPGYVIVEG